MADTAVAADSKPQRMTGGHAMARALRLQGVDTVFGMPGVQNDPLFDGFYAERNGLRVIHPRHEQGCAYMALGYAKASGRPGVFSVVPGPGVLNAGAALCTAYAINAPVLALAGEIRTEFIGKGIGQLHELPDQFAILKGLTKWAERVTTPGQMPGKLAEALKLLGEGRRRPVALELPTDVLNDSGEVTFDVPPMMPSDPEPDPDALEAAAKLLAASKQPIIVIGGGAMEAGPELLAVAELLQAPIVYGQSGKGAVSDESDFVTAYPVGHGYWAKADAVLAVGTRLALPRLVWGYDDQMKVVRLDIDPEEFDRISKPDVAILADAKVGLAALLPKLQRHLGKRPSRVEEFRDRKRAFEATIPDRVAAQHSWLQAIRAELPRDGILVDELTQVAYCARFAFPVYRPRTFICSGYQGTLGYGFATALGAQVAFPDRKVLSICGDGGFMYNVQELASAVLHNIPLVAIVFADGMYQNVKRMQTDNFQGHHIANELKNPDFVALAKSFGAEGRLARTPAELREALKAGFAAGRPYLIHVPVGEMPSPWKVLHLPKVRPARSA